MSAARTYLQEIRDLLDRLEHTQMEAIELAGMLCADALMAGRRIYVSPKGTHSIHTEVTHRAGGLIGPAILSEDAAELRAGDVVIIGTNAGFDASTVGLALRCRELGVRTIAITTVVFEYSASPFDTCDLRDALKETSWRMADICVCLFVANTEPEPCLHRGTLLSQLSKCIWLKPKRSRLTERSGKPCRIQQRYVRGGETAETQSTDQVPLCRKARDSCPRSAHDIVGDEPGELRVTDVVRVPSRGPPMRHEDQGHRGNASALHQRRENRERMNAVSVVLAVQEYAQRVVRLWPLDEPCGPRVLALRALDAGESLGVV